MSETGTLSDTEPHPAAYAAREWVKDHIASMNMRGLMQLSEAFASTSLSGNRLAEVCSETLRRLLNGEPVSDRYLLGLAWTLKSMDEQERR